MQRQRRQPARLPEWLGRWLTAHNAAARRSAWAMPWSPLSVGYLGWTRWRPATPMWISPCSPAILPVETYLHPNFTRDL